jgi:hypothetical protein
VETTDDLFDDSINSCRIERLHEGQQLIGNNLVVESLQAVTLLVVLDDHCVIIIETTLQSFTSCEARLYDLLIPETPFACTWLGTSSHIHSKVFIIKMVAMIARLTDGNRNGVGRTRSEKQILGWNMLACHAASFTT